MSDAFTLLGLDQRFALSPEQLESNYRAAQAAVHPDRFVGKTDMEKRIATDQAILINEAYQILKDPIARAGEFLRIRGIPVPGQNGQTVNDLDLLEQVLAWREILDESPNQAQLLDLRKYLNEEKANLESTFDGASVEDLPLKYLRLVYVSKTLDEITMALEN